MPTKQMKLTRGEKLAEGAHMLALMIAEDTVEEMIREGAPTEEIAEFISWVKKQEKAAKTRNKGNNHNTEKE